MKEVIFIIWVVGVAICVVWTIGRVVTALETIAESLKKLANKDT